MPCYITRPLDRREVTSQHFKDLGIQNAAPTSISNARICAVKAEIKPLMLQVREAVPALVTTQVTGKPQKMDKLSKATHVIPPDYNPLFPRPPLILSFAGKVSERDAEKLTALGFIPQSMNKYSFYRGPSTDDSVAQALKMNVLADAYSPYGTVNINGILALGIMNRIIFSAMTILPKLHTYTDVTSIVADGETVVPKGPYTVPFVKNAGDVPDKGIFFPYFDGLLLPDKTLTPAIFIHTFMNCLGSTKKELSLTTSTILKGWPSLSTTPSGLAISHLMLGIELAGKAAVSISPVYLNDEYTGFILQGDNFMVMLGAECITPVPKATLQEEINDLNRHENALQEIADILSDIKPIGEKVRESVTVDDLRTPRALHSFIANRALEPEQLQSLQKIIPRISYQQKFYNPLDHSDIAKAVNWICEGKTPNDDVPFHYRNNALYTKDTTLSILAAFGPYAPSLSTNDKTTNFSVVTTETSKLYKFKDSHVTDIPIFKLPLQEAHEHWVSFLKDGNIHMRITGVDKNKVPRIKGLGTMVASDEAQGKKILASLKTVREELRPKKKRPAGEMDEEQQAESSRNAAKRARRARDANEILTGLIPGTGDGADSSMSDSEDGW